VAETLLADAGKTFALSVDIDKKKIFLQKRNKNIKQKAKRATTREICVLLFYQNTF
jgi:hypothetical protein